MTPEDKANQLVENNGIELAIIEAGKMFEDTGSTFWDETLDILLDWEE